MMSRLRRIRPVRYIGVLLAAGLTTAWLAVGSDARVGASRVSAGAPPDAGMRNCRSRGEGTAPIKMSVTLDDVRFGPLVIGFVRNRVVTGATERSDWPFVAKAPLLLPARSRVVLAIAAEAAMRAAFQHQGGWVSAVRFTACVERVRAFAYRGTVGRTTFFPFAIAIQQRSACIPMELWIDGRESPLRRLVPIGRRRC